MYVNLTHSRSLELYLSGVCLSPAGVQSVDAPLRLPRHPAHPGALPRGADDRHPRGAAPAHRPAAGGPVRQLRNAARARWV